MGEVAVLVLDGTMLVRIARNLIVYRFTAALLTFKRLISWYVLSGRTVLTRCSLEEKQINKMLQGHAGLRFSAALTCV